MCFFFYRSSAGKLTIAVDDRRRKAKKVSNFHADYSVNLSEVQF